MHYFLLEFLKKIWAWKEEYGGHIAEQQRVMGASCDWDYSMFTMDPEPNEANIIRLPFSGEKVVLADLFRQLLELELPEGGKAVPLNSKDMARCLMGISESFKDSKLSTVYDYFRNSSGRIGKRTFPKKYRIKVQIEEF